MPNAKCSDGMHPWLACLPLLLFVVLATAFFWKQQGDDLASSYVGCRVLATGHGSSLYSYDPTNFAGLSSTDTVWPKLAVQGGYHGWLHPYVQTPLWAWMLQPLCSHLHWPAFKHLFLVLALLSIAGSIFLVARYWTPRLLHPLALSLILLALCFSEPFLFAMKLVQTHALLLFLTIAGVILAQRNRPLAAGLCVALAAAVKITPGILFLYWLASRRWKAACSLLFWSVLLLAASRLAAGAALFHDYLENMRRVSHILLVAENNQSLASWYMTRLFSPDEVFDVNAFSLPAALSSLSTLCMAACTLGGGLLDHRSDRVAATQGSRARPPLGAGVALVAMTVFAPIAWTHYYIVMVTPLMMLVETAWHFEKSKARWLVYIAIFIIAALLYRPLAPDVIRMDLSDYALLHGTFYSAILCIVVFLLVGLCSSGFDRYVPIRRDLPHSPKQH